MGTATTAGFRLRTKLFIIAVIVYAMLVGGVAISLYNESQVFNFVEKTNTFVKWMMDTYVQDDTTALVMYQKYYQDSLDAHFRSRLFSMGILLFSLGVMLILGFYFVRKITGPIHRLVAAMQQVTQGDLTVTVAVETKDEIGEASRTLNTLVNRLNSNMLSVLQSADAVLGGSQELSSAAEQLSSSVQEQASSLEETAASMEEMTSTVKQNADNALRADKVALDARTAANAGVMTSSSVKQSMEAINSSSTKIADIIGVIDEIAFQTNLLALNAAVEAARAGEQGRGFAVVAAEVRNLAQRSASAAKEIKALIQDSVEKVQGGTQLVNTSSKTLEGIVESVKNTADIIAEISASSQEQASGIDQVNRAIMQMDGVTQSNAAQVEELSGTSQSLAVQAEQLRNLVSHFTLETAAGIRLGSSVGAGDKMKATKSSGPSAAVESISSVKPAKGRNVQHLKPQIAAQKVGVKGGDWTEF